MTLSRRAPFIATCLFIAVAGCTAGPNDNENLSNGALLGGGIGALVGVVSGDTTQERRQAAIIGAAIGAAGGAAIGNQLDRQEEELRRALGNDVNIVNTGDTLTVTLPQDILFATDSATLTAGLQSDLAAVARSLNTNPDTLVTVTGHTDNTGDAGYNFALSQRRAQAVTTTLTQAGVMPSRLSSIGRGEDAPLATNLTPQGRQQNRRVEIVITPI